MSSAAPCGACACCTARAELDDELAAIKASVQQLATDQRAAAASSASIATELAALRLAPALIRLVVVALAIGLLALGVVGSVQVALKGWGLEALTRPVVGP